jgi:hypothetical protein
VKISLIIPIYNEAQHFERFLKMIDGDVLGYPKDLPSLIKFIADDWDDVVIGKADAKQTD